MTMELATIPKEAYTAPQCVSEHPYLLVKTDYRPKPLQCQLDAGHADRHAAASGPAIRPKVVEPLSDAEGAALEHRW